MIRAPTKDREASRRGAEGGISALIGYRAVTSSAK